MKGLTLENTHSQLDMRMVTLLHAVCSESMGYGSAVTSKIKTSMQELQDASTIACGSRATGTANSSKCTVRKVIFHQTPVPTYDTCLMQLTMHML